MPRAVGVVAPEQVRAGVHRGLSDLCARTLSDNPGRHLEPITSPEQLAKAVDQLPKIRQPEPEPLVLPEYPTRNYPGRGYPAGPGQGGPATQPRRPGPPPPPQYLPAPAGRSGRALRWAVSLVVLAAVGLGSWGIAEVLMKQNGSTGKSPVTAGVGGNSKPSATAQKTLRALKISGATEFSPRDVPIAANQVPLSIDGDTGTAWKTYLYKRYSNFGNLPSRADGSGIVVDLGSVRSVSAVKLVLPVSGETLEVLAAPSDASSAPTGGSAAFSQRIANLGKISGTGFTSATLATPVRTRFVLIHLTEPPRGPLQFQQLPWRHLGDPDPGLTSVNRPWGKNDSGEPVRGREPRAVRRRAAGPACRGGPRRLRRTGRPPPGPALGGGPAHPGRPRGGRGRPAGRPGLGVPRRTHLPGAFRGHHLAAPHRGERLPGPCPAQRDQADPPAGAGAAQEALLGLDEGADVSAERGELRRELGLALASLPQEQRAALVLVDMQGYPVAEAAEVLGVPVGTVKSRCARGRTRLLPLLAHLRTAGVRPFHVLQPPGATAPHGTPRRPDRRRRFT